MTSSGTPIRPRGVRLRRGPAVALLALAAACATAGSPLERGATSAPASALTAAAFHDWLRRGDAASAAARFAAAVERDGRDPWARLGAALAARRVLDDEAEATHLLALMAGAPGHPLAAVAARRLVELASRGPSLAAPIERGLAALLGEGRLAGLAAYRARAARAAAAADPERAAALRAENGAVQRWTILGPCGALASRDLERPFPPEAGALPPRLPGPPGEPAVEARPLWFPDGLVVMDGEPGGADIWYLASDVRLARGGRYLVAVGATVSMWAWLDGAPLAERRALTGYPPGAWMVPLDLPPGTHRLLLKVARGTSRATLALAFARADGAPSDAESAPAATGPAAPARPGPAPAPLGSARDLALALEPEAGPVLARLLAARDRLDTDREAAKALLAEAAGLLPDSPPVLAARGEVLQDDPTLSERVARARAESAYVEALRRDPGDAATRLELAELLRAEDRLDDLETALGALGRVEASRPQALLARARFLVARGFPEGAEKLLEAAPGDCQAREMSLSLASRRGAVAKEDELARALPECPGGLERQADLLRQRGQVARSVELWRRLVRAAPARTEPRLSLARALDAAGDPAGAAREVGELERTWPREAQLPRRRADLLELAGDRAAARAERERALALDGSDLTLRRALALEDGTDVLASLALDGRQAIRAWEASSFRPASSSVLVLDGMAAEAYPDGAWTERIHQVAHLADPRGVERWGEVTLPSGAQVLSLRTIKPDGRVLEPDQTGGPKSSASLAGLEPGDFVEVEYLRSHRARGAALPGFSVDPFFFRAEELPFFRSTLTVAAPAGTGLEVDAHNTTAPPPRLEGGREVVRVEAHQVEALVSEPDDPGPSEYLPFVQVGAGAGQEALQLAAADGFLERSRASLEVRELAAAVAHPPRGAAPSGEALLRAAYDRVNEVVEGQGGSWAEPASQVLSRGRGNRTLLLKAVYAALGVKARLALVRPFGADPAPYRFPRPDLYGYLVLRVEQGGKVAWLDPTTRYTPFGTLPQAARGCEALVLPEPGEAPEVTRTPRGDGEGREALLRIALDRDGGAAIQGEERYLGFDAAAARAALERLDAPSRRQVVEQSLARSFRGLALESLEVEGEGRADVPLTLRWRARAPAVARLADGRASSDAVIYPLRLGARFVQRAARATPLLVAVEERATLRVEVTLPPGAAPPEGTAREVTSPFGSYRRTERWDGKALVREDRFDLERERIRPEAYQDFARFAASVDEAQGEPTALGTWR